MSGATAHVRNPIRYRPDNRSSTQQTRGTENRCLDRYKSPKEARMPFTDILILTGIILAFVIFGLGLAWGEYQTRHLHRGVQSRDADDNKIDMKKAA
jgi:hypothetical protein